MLKLKKHNKNSIGLIGHTIVNYPSPKLCRESIKVMVDEGVDLIELQIPFSEPVADGPVFMAANHQALAAGVNLEQSFALMQEVTQQYKIPFVFMTYANIVFKKGFAKFVTAATEVGASGAIVPDLPIEDADIFLEACEKNSFAPIQVIPPNVSEQRLPDLIHAAKGFIYAVARSGVTGTKTKFNAELPEFINRIRVQTDLPIAVGFGVTTAADINFLKPIADYAIVGSQSLRVLQEKGLQGLSEFWSSLKKAAV